MSIAAPSQGSPGRYRLPKNGPEFEVAPAVPCAWGASPRGESTTREPAAIFSEGTRLAADLWLSDDVDQSERLPAILLCHGWGGLKEHLNATYAPWFAKAGFAVLAFDYRGWGESDARWVPTGPAPVPDDVGEATLRARVVREVVDPFDQLRDIQNCLDYLEGHPRVDRERIGLWGTSYGGGHVVFLAAHDPRVKVIVAQVGAQQPAEGLIASGLARERALARARGELGPIPPKEDGVPGLAGTPDLAKMQHYRPIATAGLVRTPTLVIDAEKDDTKAIVQKTVSFVEARLARAQKIESR